VVQKIPQIIEGPFQDCVLQPPAAENLLLDIVHAIESNGDQRAVSLIVSASSPAASRPSAAHVTEAPKTSYCPTARRTRQPGWMA